MNDPVIPAAVFTLWTWALVVGYLVLLPTAVYWLHTLWRAAASIRRYAAESADAAEAIAANCRALPALDATIGVAGEMLDAAGAVANKLDAAASALESRVAQG